MPWSVRQIGQLLQLAEAGELTADELRRAGQHAPLEPVRETWLRAADRLLAFAGVLLLTAAVVFFFAWNWADMHRFVKFGLALAALTACTGTAIAGTPYGTVYRAALFGACVATGALLALIGQSYQTGADIWELFLAWALLMSPFVLLSRSAASWALWVVIANLALTRMLWQTTLFGFFGDLFKAGPLLLVAALNLSVLLAFEAFESRLLVAPRRHLQRLASLGVLAPLVAGGIVGWWERALLPVSLVFLVVATTGAWVYYRLRRDLVILSLALFASIAVATAALVRVLPDSADFLLMNLVAMAVIVGSAFAAAWIVRLHRQGSSL